YNIVEDQADDVFKKANEKGIGIIVMKPLAGGALDDATLAIKYILSKSYIDVAIPGMDSIEEVRQNTDVLENLKLTQEDNEKIEEIRKSLGNRFCRRCEYCLPCPVGVNIPANFLLEGYYTRYNLKDWAIQRYEATNGKASECINCGLCETKCPYDLPIRDMLKD
ncbi:aldo/keto reductase, partial [Clostridium tertium]